MANTASGTPPVVAFPVSNLFVTFVVRSSSTWYCGIGCPVGVGVPPVQTIYTSPIKAVTSSTGAFSGVDVAVQLIVDCAQAMLARPTAAINASVIVLKYAAMFVYLDCKVFLIGSQCTGDIVLLSNKFHKTL